MFWILPIPFSDNPHKTFLKKVFELPDELKSDWIITFMAITDSEMSVNCWQCFDFQGWMTVILNYTNLIEYGLKTGYNIDKKSLNFSRKLIV